MTVTLSPCHRVTQSPHRLLNLFLQIPLEIRLLLLFLAGAVIGGQLNRGIYRLAYNRRLDRALVAARRESGPPLGAITCRSLAGWAWPASRRSARGRLLGAAALIELACGIGLRGALLLGDQRRPLADLPGLAGAVTAGAFALAMPEPSVAHFADDCGHLHRLRRANDSRRGYRPRHAGGSAAGGGRADLAVANDRMAGARLGSLLVSSAVVLARSGWMGRGDWRRGWPAFGGWCLAIVPSLWTMRRGLVKADPVSAREHGPRLGPVAVRTAGRIGRGGHCGRLEFRRRAVAP